MPSYSGGLNRTDFFAVNAAGTGLVTVTAHTMVPTVTAVTNQADAFLKAIKNFSTGYTPVRLGKGIEMAYDQTIFGGDILNACDVYQAGDSAATVEYYEDASEADPITTSGTTVNNMLGITYVGADPDQTNTVLVYIHHCNFKEGSGAFVSKKGERIKPKLDTSSSKTKAALVIDKDCFDATLVTVAADITLASGKEFTRLSLPKAT
jgi:hypothetical protein